MSICNCVKCGETLNKADSMSSSPCKRSWHVNHQVNAAAWQALSPNEKSNWKCGICQSAISHCSTNELGAYIDEVVSPLRDNGALRHLTDIICSLFIKVSCLESENLRLSGLLHKDQPSPQMAVDPSPLDEKEKKVLLIGDEGVKPFQDIKSLLKDSKGFIAKSAPHKDVPNILLDVKEILRCPPGDYHIFLHSGQFDCVNRKGKEAIDAIELMANQLNSVSPGSKLSVATVPNHNDECRAFNNALFQHEIQETLSVVNLENIQVSMVLSNSTTYDSVSIGRVKPILARKMAAHLGTRLKKSKPADIIQTHPGPKNIRQKGSKDPPIQVRKNKSGRPQKIMRTPRRGANTPPWSEIPVHPMGYGYQPPYQPYGHITNNAWANGPPRGLYRRASMPERQYR